MAGVLWGIITLLVVFWIVGFLLHVGGALIHLLLVIAVIVLLFNLLRGRGTTPTAPFFSARLGLVADVPLDSIHLGRNAVAAFVCDRLRLLAKRHAVACRLTFRSLGFSRAAVRYFVQRVVHVIDGFFGCLF